jgi:hypothetical protein
VLKQVAAFRRAVESAVQERHGAITIYQAKRIRTAAMALRQSLVVGRIMADAGIPGPDGPLDHPTWQGYSDRLLRYEETCDRALKDLGLDRAKDVADMWDEFYKSQRLNIAEQIVQPNGSPVAQDDNPASQDIDGQPTAPDSAAGQQGVTEA